LEKRKGKLLKKIFYSTIQRNPTFSELLLSLTILVSVKTVLPEWTSVVVHLMVFFPVDIFE